MYFASVPALAATRSLAAASCVLILKKRGVTDRKGRYTGFTEVRQ